MRIRVKHTKGKHYCNFLSLVRIMWASLFKKEAHLIFTDSAKYTLDETDQADFNKVIGRGGLKIKNGPRKEEQFIVWRYIPEANQFHIAKYWRENYEFDFSDLEIIEGSGSVRVNLSHFKSLLPLGGYFGGRDSDGNGIGGKAPRNLEYFLEL